jgi:uncharacterized protein (UPF0332 family)
MPENLSQLINYRIQQAYESIAEVEFQISNNYFNTAVNRIYYGMFYILLALALKHNFKTSKHKQLIGWFNKEFIKSGQVDVRLGNIIHKAYEDRTDSDYGIFIQFEKAEVQSKLEQMKEFIGMIEKLIKE